MALAPVFNLAADNRTVTLATPLAAGSYNLQLIATQTGAGGSPLTVNIPITVQAGLPGTPTALSLVSTTASSAVISFAPPASGGALDRGRYQVQYIITGGTYSDNGPAIPYCTPNSGSITDAFGNVWAITAGAQITINNIVDTPTNSVSMMLLSAGRIWQLNTLNDWFGFTPSGPINNPAAQVDPNWSAGTTTSPLTAVTIAGLSTGTTYSVRVYVTNSTGSGAPTSPIPVTPSAGGPGPPPPNATFFDDFTSQNAALWFRNSYDEGGDIFWNNDPALTPQIYTYSNSQLHLSALNISTGGKPYTSGIQDSFNPSNNFAQRYGYWEISVAVDRFIGLQFDFNLLASNGDFPPAINVGSIWTDASNVMHVWANVSGVDQPVEVTSPGFDPSTVHTYGFEWTPSIVALYRDRVVVGSWPNPGGVYTTDFLYMKMYLQSGNYFPGQTAFQNPSALPKAAHIGSVTVWPSKPF